MGYYDLPALINYILEVTGNESLFYIGHSMGCAVIFIMASLKPELCSKITAIAALAPAVYIKHVKAPFPKLAAPFASTFVRTYLL
jgi:lysosomal acid lipase/cholesteryl ester hydrolase